MEKFAPKLTDKDRLQLKINGLSNHVRHYLAISEALTFNGMEDEVISQLQEAKLTSRNAFTDEHRAELDSFTIFKDSLDKQETMKETYPINNQKIKVDGQTHSVSQGIMLDGKEYFIHGQSHKPEDKGKTDPYALLFQHTEDGAVGLKVVRQAELNGK